MMLLPILALALGAPAAQEPPPEMAQAAGPRGTSGEVHEDAIGYAATMDARPDARWSEVTVGVAHPSLPAGTLVELTALDTGRTIVAMVVARETKGAIVALSPGAAHALGVGDHAGVRVRTVVATPQDARALRSGQAATQRLDAPPALLTALRRKLPEQHAARAVTPVRATPARATSVQTPAVHQAPVRAATASAAPAAKPVAPAARSGMMVQVAALSSSDRAATLAQQMGGRVVPLGKLYRVQLGPFADTASAQRARDGAARHGYADARIIPLTPNQ